jgi:hypothetical protein
MMLGSSRSTPGGRVSAHTIRVGCLLLIAGLAALGDSALAAEPPKNKADRAKAEPTASSGASTSSAGSTASTEAAGLINRWRGRKVSKWWEVAARWETHFLVRQNDLGGAGVNKVVNGVWLSGGLDLTANNHLGVSGGWFQRYIADDGETGARAADLVFSYTRTQPLPKRFSLRGSFSVSAPISYASQRAGVITAPSLGLGVSRAVGPVSLTLGTSGGLNLCKYTTAGVGDVGGMPNVRGVYGVSLGAELRFPFLSKLKRYSHFWDKVVPHLQRFTLGFNAFTAWIWFYDVGTQPPPGSPYMGAVQDVLYPDGQAAQQAYGWEVALSHAFPKFYGIGMSASLTFAEGDGVVGAPSILHDGIQRFYLFWRQNSAFYTSITARF